MYGAYNFKGWLQRGQRFVSAMSSDINSSDVHESRRFCQFSYAWYTKDVTFKKLTDHSEIFMETKIYHRKKQTNHGYKVKASVFRNIYATCNSLHYKDGIPDIEIYSKKSLYAHGKIQNRPRSQWLENIEDRLPQSVSGIKRQWILWTSENPLHYIYAPKSYSKVRKGSIQRWEIARW